MYWVLMWGIGPANNTTRCSGLSKRREPTTGWTIANFEQRKDVFIFAQFLWSMLGFGSKSFLLFQGLLG